MTGSESRPPLGLRTAVRVAASSFALLSFGCEEDPGLQRRVVGLEHPERLDFGRVQLGLGRVLDFALINAGTVPVRVEGWQVEANGAAEVTVAPDALVLPAAATETITVRFRPLLPTDTDLELALQMRTDIGPRTLTLVGRGVREGLRAEPDPLRFGRVLRGRTSVRSLDVTATLPEAVNLRWSVRPSGGGGRFDVVDPQVGPGGDLGALSAGDRRRLRLRYTPAATGPAGPDRAVGVLRFCPSPECEVSVALEGEAILDPLRCTPNPIDFGAVRPDRRRAAFTTCTNTSERAVRILGASMVPTSDSVFSTPTVSASVLEPADSELFEVQLDTPRDAELGPRTGRLRLEVQDAEDAAPLPVHDVGIEARVGGALLRVEPPAVDFGRVALGLAGQADLRITNAGADVLSVNELVTAPPFSVVDPPASIQLSAGQSAELSLRFAPTGAGVASGVLRISSDAVEAPVREVELGGIGLDLQACDAVVEPQFVEFGPVALFRSTTRGVQVKNRGTAPCLVRAPRLAAGSSPPFTFVQGEGDVLLQPGEAWTYVLGFRPERLGLATGAFEVQISNAGQPNLTVPIRGGGTSFALALSPDEIDFGEVAAGCASPQAVRVFNPGESTVRVTSVRLRTLGAVTSFRLEGLPAPLLGANPPGLQLESGAALEFQVRFVPTTMVSRELGRVEVVVDGQPEPFAVALYGRADPDPFITERFVQAVATSVDILFVIDNSTSMGAEQSALRSSFSRFIRYAEDRNLDFRVGVVSTDTDIGGSCRRDAQVPAPGTPRGGCGFLSEGSPTQTNRQWRLVEQGEQPSPQAAFEAISDVGLQGSAREAGLQAAAFAIEPGRLTGWNAGLLRRPDAFFAVVVVSDEDDQSPGSVGVYEAQLAAAKGDRYRARYALNGIIVDDAGCGSVVEDGRYFGAIRRSGGTVGSICDSSFDAAIDRIARASAGVRERFPLRRPAFSPSVEVTVDRVPLAAISNGKRRWSYEVDANVLLFEPDSVPREGAQVVIRYRPRCFTP